MELARKQSFLPQAGGAARSYIQLAAGLNRQIGSWKIGKHQMASWPFCHDSFPIEMIWEWRSLSDMPGIFKESRTLRVYFFGHF